MVKDTGSLIKFNPASSVTPPKNNSYIPEYYTEVETSAFLQAAKGDLCETALSFPLSIVLVSIACMVTDD